MPDPTSSPEPLPLRVSAILLVDNQRDHARRAIQALLASEGADRTEILLLDCASQDGTAALDQEFPGINILRLPHHIGAARAYNIATRTAKAPLLMFVSPDIEVQPETLRLLAEALDSEPETVAACPLLISASGEPAPHVYPLPDPSEIGTRPLSAAVSDFSQPATIEYPTMEALMVRKQFIQAMNYFDQRYGHYWVDAELAMQARRAGKKMRFFPSARVTFHPAPDPLAGSPVAVSDRIVGASEYAAKYGSGGFTMRLAAAIRALSRLELSLFIALLGSRKLDGSQV